MKGGAQKVEGKWGKEKGRGGGMKKERRKDSR